VRHCDCVGLQAGSVGQVERLLSCGVQKLFIADRTDTVSCLVQRRYRRMEIKEKRDFVSGKYKFLGTKHTVFVILIYFPLRPVCNANFRDRIVFR